jgi:hypothetical protein
MYAAALSMPGSPSPSSKEKSCGLMPLNQSKADMPVGGDENKREAALRASCDMLAPRPVPPGALLVLGCTERTNSMVC